MTRYVCLLRAINVGGQRKMKMAELRDLCESLGFADVTTYLQSGNVVLSTVAARSTLASKLAKAIGDKCGYAQITVLVRTAAELAGILAANPFLRVGSDPAKLHVTFLERDPEKVAIRALGTNDWLPDELAPGKCAVYVHCPNGYGRTKLNNGFFERKLGLMATTRNWKTVTQLHALASP